MVFLLSLRKALEEILLKIPLFTTFKLGDIKTYIPVNKERLLLTGVQVRCLLTPDMNCVWNLRFKSENLAVILGHYYEEVWPFTTTEMLLQMTVCTTWFFRSSCLIAERIVVEHCYMTSCYLQLLVTTYVPLALHSNASLLEIFSSASKAPQMGLKRHNSVSISLRKMDSFRSGDFLDWPL